MGFVEYFAGGMCSLYLFRVFRDCFWGFGWVFFCVLVVG